MPNNRTGCLVCGATYCHKVAPRGTRVEGVQDLPAREIERRFAYWKRKQALQRLSSS